MKKYWIKDLTNRQVIHAPTEEIARKLCNKFHEMGLKWSSGDSYLNDTYWNRYGETTCYRPNSKTYGHTNFYTRSRFQILTIDQLLDFQDGEFLALDDVKSIEEAARINQLRALGLVLTLDE